MFKLMRLEMKKYKFGGYIKGAMIANAVILGLLTMLYFILNVEGELNSETLHILISLIDSIIRGTFMVFGGVIIANVVIEEYINKTINILFSSPISRKRLMVSKLLIVVIFTFVAIIVSNLFITSVFYMITSYFAFVPGVDSNFLLLNSGKILTNALAASFIALIPLYFGMKKKSKSATIVSSFIPMVIITSNSGGFSLNDIIVVPIGLGVIGILIAYYAIKDIDKKDIKG